MRGEHLGPPIICVKPGCFFVVSIQMEPSPVSESGSSLDDFNYIWSLFSQQSSLSKYTYRSYPGTWFPPLPHWTECQASNVVAPGHGSIEKSEVMSTVHGARQQHA